MLVEMRVLGILALRCKWEFYILSISYFKGCLICVVAKGVIVPSFPHSPETEEKELSPQKVLIKALVLNYFPHCHPPFRLEVIDRKLWHIHMVGSDQEVNPKLLRIVIIEKHMVGVFERDVANLAFMVYIYPLPCRILIRRQFITKELQNEKLDFVGCVKSPHPSPVPKSIIGSSPILLDEISTSYFGGEAFIPIQSPQINMFLNVWVWE